MSGLHRNLGLGDALKIAERLGVTIERIRGTGELRLRFPWRPAPLRINARRHDAPRKLISLLRQHQARAEGGA